MAADEIRAQSKESVGGYGFIIFLMLILILIVNKHTFKSYFNLLEQELKTAQNIINTISVTAEGLKTALAAPQKAAQESEL